MSNISIKENNLKELIKESIQQVIKEWEDRIEDIPTFQVFTENISLTELPKILESNIYDSNDNLIGKLTDLHFKYDCGINQFI